MKNLLLITLFASFLFNACNTEKTEIILSIMPAESAEEKTLEKAMAFEEDRETAISVIEKRILAAATAKPVKGIKIVMNKPEVISERAIDPDKIKFTINRKVDPDILKKVLELRLEVGFYETYMSSEFWEYLAKADEVITEIINAGKIDLPADTSMSPSQKGLFRFLFPMFSAEGQLMPGSMAGNARATDTAIINRLLAMESVGYCFPRDLRLVWSHKPYPGSEDYYSLIAIKMSSFSGSPLLSDRNIVKASADLSQFTPMVNISMDTEGARLWSRITSENIDRDIAFIVNGRVYMHPRVVQAIESGNSTISADLTEEEALTLAVVLGSGYMPPLNIKVLSVN